MSNRKDFTNNNTEFTGTGGIVLPKGTTGERPTGAVGQIRFNTTTGAMENFTAEGWFPVSVSVPTLATVANSIYAGATSTLTLTGTNFGIAAGTVRFTANASVTNVTITPSSVTSATVAVPSEIFNLSTGTSVDVQLINSDNGISNVITKTIVGLPTGGAITTAGGYRVHTITSSTSLVVPTGFTATVDYLLVAGGGSGGDDIAGGGGAGGMVTGTAAISANTYSVVIGAGGASTIGTEGTGRGNNGAPSSVFGVTAIGGGAGGGEGQTAANSGGSGGGAGYSTGSGGAGTAGQGNSGGNSSGGTCAGGGGKGAAAANVSSSATAGGAGLQNNFDGNNYYYAGGGGGGSYSGGTAAAGGLGGGGGGVGGYPASAVGAGGTGGRNAGTAGATTWGGSNGGKGGNAGANTGSGGGGSSETNAGVFSASGAGGSGIVIVRYTL